MAGCGYVCPLCEGTGFDEKGGLCDYCSKAPEADISNQEIEEWVKKVHEGPCCSDLGTD